MKKLAANLIALHTCLGLCLAQRGELLPRANKHRYEQMLVHTSDGRRAINIRETLLEGKSPDGKAMFGSMLVLFDPHSRCYSWQYAAAWSPENYHLFQIDDLRRSQIAVFSEQNRLIVFRSAGGAVFVRIDQDIVPTIEEAEKKAIQTALNHRDSSMASPSEGWIEISLKELGFEFTISKQAPVHGVTKILGIKNFEGKWELLIENQGRAKVILSDDFKTIEANLLP